MQWSTMCRKLADAALLVLARTSTWEVYCDWATSRDTVWGGYPLPNLLSQLLLKWAPTVGRLEIVSDFIEAPGAQEFVVAATNLTSAALEYGVRVEASLIGSVLSSSRSLTSLTVSGLHIPARLPCQLQHLQVSLNMDKYLSTSSQEKHAYQIPMAVEALMSALSSAPSLQSLHVDLLEYCVHPAVSKLRLPKLKEVSICGQVGSEGSLQLGWLTGVSDKLHIRLSFLLGRYGREALDMHKQAAQQLQKLQVSTLDLCMSSQSSSEVQEVWGLQPAFLRAQKALNCEPGDSIRCALPLCNNSRLVFTTIWQF